MEFEGLARLEDIISRLLSQHAELKKQNEMLAVEVDEKNWSLVGFMTKFLRCMGIRRRFTIA